MTWQTVVMWHLQKQYKSRFYNAKRKRHFHRFQSPHFRPMFPYHLLGCTSLPWSLKVVWKTRTTSHPQLGTCRCWRIQSQKSKNIFISLQRTELENLITSCQLWKAYSWMKRKMLTSEKQAAAFENEKKIDCIINLSVTLQPSSDYLLISRTGIADKVWPIPITLWCISPRSITSSSSSSSLLSE